VGGSLKIGSIPSGNIILDAPGQLLDPYDFHAMGEDGVLQLYSL